MRGWQRDGSQQGDPRRQSAEPPILQNADLCRRAANGAGHENQLWHPWWRPRVWRHLPARGRLTPASEARGSSRRLEFLAEPIALAVVEYRASTQIGNCPCESSAAVDQIAGAIASSSHARHRRGSRPGRRRPSSREPRATNRRSRFRRRRCPARA